MAVPALHKTLELFPFFTSNTNGGANFQHTYLEDITIYFQSKKVTKW